MLLVDMVVLLWSSVSCSNLFFMICMADLTGMDVIGNDAFSSVQLVLCDVICKFTAVIDMVDGITSKGF